MTPRPVTTWADIRDYVDTDTEVADRAGTTWRRTSGGGTLRVLYAYDDNNEIRFWSPRDEDEVYLPLAAMPEPPDGTRIEFGHGTDVYGAWRDDASSAEAGWAAGDGGFVWCLYGGSVPKTWDMMWAAFGESLRCALRLVPEAAGAPIPDVEARPAPVGSWWRTDDGGVLQVSGDYLDGPGDQIVTYTLYRQGGHPCEGKWGGKELAEAYTRIEVHEVPDWVEVAW